MQATLLPSQSDDRAKPSGNALVFPWLLFFLTWAITFGIQNRMDASLVWLDAGGPAAQMAQNAADGNTSREILITLLGLVGVVLLYRSRRQRFKPQGWAGMAFLCYYGWAALSCLWAQIPLLVVRRQVAFAMILLLLFGLARNLSIDALSLFCMAIPLFNLPIGIFAEMRNGTFHPWSGGRFGGTVHPNLQGAGLALATLIALWWAWRSRGGARMAFTATGAVLALFLFWTQSRSSMIALAAALGFSLALLLVRSFPISPTRFLAVAALGFAILSLLGLLTVNSASLSGPEHEVQTARDEGDPSQLTGRVDLWRLLTTYAKARPILGYGYEGFWSDQNIENISNDLQWSINEAHSAYLDQWLNLGTVGLVIYVSILLLALYKSSSRFLRGDNPYGYCAAIIFFVIVHNFTESINTLPTYPNFVLNLFLIHVSFSSMPALNQIARRHLSWQAPVRKSF